MKLYEGQIKQIQKSLLDAGLEADMLEDLDMEQTFKVFEPMFKPSAANNEILVWKEGKPRLYKVHDDLLYNALIAYDNRAIAEVFGVFFKPFEKSNNLIRSGITASPYFTVRTFWRSLAQILVKTEATGINYITHPARVAKAYGSVWKSVLSDMNSKIPQSKAVSEWWKSGGAQSTFISVEKQYLNRELDKIALNKKAWHYLKSMKQGTRKERLALNWYILKMPFTGFLVLQTFNDTLDQALKLAEYQVVKKQTGSRQKLLWHLVRRMWIINVLVVLHENLIKLHFSSMYLCKVQIILYELSRNTSYVLLCERLRYLHYQRFYSMR